MKQKLLQEDDCHLLGKSERKAAIADYVEVNTMLQKRKLRAEQDN